MERKMEGLDDRIEPLFGDIHRVVVAVHEATKLSQEAIRDTRKHTQKSRRSRNPQVS